MNESERKKIKEKIEIIEKAIIWYASLMAGIGKKDKNLPQKSKLIQDSAGLLADVTSLRDSFNQEKEFSIESINENLLLKVNVVKQRLESFKNDINTAKARGSFDEKKTMNCPQPSDRPAHSEHSFNDTLKRVIELDSLLRNFLNSLLRKPEKEIAEENKKLLEENKKLLEENKEVEKIQSIFSEKNNSLFFRSARYVERNPGKIWTAVGLVGVGMMYTGRGNAGRDWESQKLQVMGVSLSIAGLIGICGIFNNFATRISNSLFGATKETITNWGVAAKAIESRVNDIGDKGCRAILKIDKVADSLDGTASEISEKIKKLDPKDLKPTVKVSIKKIGLF